MADPSKIQESKDRYLREKVDRFLVTVPKGQKQLIADFAAKQGESVNGFVNRLIREAMGKEEDEE